MTQYATYCPEDNKLRLYVGRVPRDEYDTLKAEGWTSTPKQDCQFAAVWTPERNARALSYSPDGIEDEDQAPAERAADRAERFAGYRDKREGEALTRADTYDAGPAAHGYQSNALAVRRAERHDLQAARAVDRWSKATYWTERTAGVISHALHMSGPGVRMGRIKTLEADLRRMRPGSEWHTHTALRLAYENQMIEAQGGRAADVEMIPGGFWKGAQIEKVNKSNATGRVVSVVTRGPRRTGYNYRVESPAAVEYSLYQHMTERAAPDSYRAPTPEELDAFHAARKAEKAARPKSTAPQLINPTEEEAERLQAIWNRATLAHFADLKARGKFAPAFVPSTVYRTTQAEYSANSGGTYSAFEPRELCKGGIECPRHHLWTEEGRKRLADAGPVLCKVRTRGSNGNDYGARRVILLTDKPGKPLPAAIWPAPAETREILELRA